MLKDKSLLKYTNLFCPNDYKKNDKIMLKYFQQNLNNLLYRSIVNIAMFAINIKNLKKLKILYIFLKNCLLFAVSVDMNMKRY